MSKLFGYEFRKIKKTGESPYPEILKSDYVPSTYVNFMGKFNPSWLPMNQMDQLTGVLNKNPILYSVLNIRAKYINNLKTGVEDIKTGRIYTKDNLYKNGAPNELVVKCSI